MSEKPSVKLDGLIRYLESMTDARYSENPFIEQHGQPILHRGYAINYLKELKDSGVVRV